ncbi:uncharacterized protein LOC134206029 [Armigeres subalbatus]|uniref:uncharacterized protein LOC134206029 n=1 Tax=Armigeres subalbatus TaxID=124917 RepID=UPI002ED00B19
MIIPIDVRSSNILEKYSPMDSVVENNSKWVEVTHYNPKDLAFVVQVCQFCDFEVLVRFRCRTNRRRTISSPRRVHLLKSGVKPTARVPSDLVKRDWKSDIGHVRGDTAREFPKFAGESRQKGNWKRRRSARTLKLNEHKLAYEKRDQDASHNSGLLQASKATCGAESRQHKTPHLLGFLCRISFFVPDQIRPTSVRDRCCLAGGKERASLGEGIVAIGGDQLRNRRVVCTGASLVAVVCGDIVIFDESIDCLGGTPSSNPVVLDGQRGLQQRSIVGANIGSGMQDSRRRDDRSTGET